jgi:hypothetical protein
MFRATTPNPVDLALAGFPLVQVAGIRVEPGQRTAGIKCARPRSC